MSIVNDLNAISSVSLECRFSEVTLWSRDHRARLGQGGWTLMVRGTSRLRRMAEAWRRIVQVVAKESDERLLCFLSSVFDEASESPSIMRIPSVLIESERGQRRQFEQFLSREQLQDALDGMEGVQLFRAENAPPPQAGDSFVSVQDYVENVRRVLSPLERGELSKVVLCRDEIVPGDEELWRTALVSLEEQYPQCWTFAVGGLMGATPELLASRTGDRVHSRVLAGSLPRGGDGSDEERRSRLLHDDRFLREHAHAARSVVEGLESVIELDEDHPEPFVLELPNIVHLATDVRGTAQDPEASVVNLVDQIHPTAAVAGVPRREAMDLIRDVEGRDRGCFAGPVGWMDSTGAGEIALALRCGQVEQDRIRIFAGGGIVAGAVPEDEVAETVSKMAPMRSALKRAL